MHTFILTLHILVALITTVSIGGVFASAFRRRETRVYSAMIISFAATAVSGVALLFVSTHGLGRFCAMMSMYTVFVVVARQYYRKQNTITSSL